MFTVYAIYNLCNGKGYIGYTSKTAERRFYKHKEASRLGSSNYLHRAMRKYGPEVFDFLVLWQGESRRAALAQEMDSIAAFRYNNPQRGYNQTSGGEGMFNPSEETRHRLSAWQKGKPKTLEHRRKLSEAKKGKPASRGSLLALRNSGGHTGFPHSEETRRKISAAKMRRKE